MKKDVELYEERIRKEIAYKVIVDDRPFVVTFIYENNRLSKVTVVDGVIDKGIVLDRDFFKAIYKVLRTLNITV